MYIEKRKTKNGIKYFLGHSFREGGKIHKIRKLLGTNLPKDILEDRRKKAEKLILDEIEKYGVIKDPLYSKLSNEEIEFVRQLEKEAKLEIFHLSEEEWQTFSELFTYNTNAIEGSELTNIEVKEIIENDKWPKEKSKEDIAEAYGVDEAIEFIRKTKEHISLDLIKELHKIVFKNSKSFAGEFRKKGEEVVVRTSLGEIVHEGAPQSRVNSLLNELVKWYEKYKGKYPGLILASVIHNQFENIHPFADGNGRVGRILLNNILLKNKLPPVNIELKHRIEYYNTLQEYEKNKNLQPTIDFLLKEYKVLKKVFKK
ncbi:cell filamentation protein Fic [Candidatus Pacearchaeota archaeon]|nr:cell filamentation protein Fic [Candidatus Pacearchaeota archaeon]MAG07246.1 cell filamentation protein Fic [Candidatus Pacearchaeota archaeon]|tara:strand:+ start:117 stop:1058 length:942 start_codon:yes stop_codon:yes gene_type:complete